MAVDGYHAGPRESGAADAGSRRASLSPQSKTLRAGVGAGARPITFREAARLQSVCDSFVFSGFGEEMARQIGNGVPTNLARAVARAVQEVI